MRRGRVIAKFRALSLARLFELEKDLRERYPDRVEQVSLAVSTLAHKLYYLNRNTVADYVYTVKSLSKTFPELAELVPDADTVKRLLGVEQ